MKRDCLRVNYFCKDLTLSQEERNACASNMSNIHSPWFPLFSLFIGACLQLENINELLTMFQLTMDVVTVNLKDNPIQFHW